jgi:molybdate transport system substrate-binding protein
MKTIGIRKDLNIVNSERFMTISLLVFIIIFSGCTTAPEQSTIQKSQPASLRIFAAASLTEPFTEIGQAFEALNPGISVVFNFAGSQQLAQQINAGAPVDVFASANHLLMNTVVEGGRIDQEDIQTFASNRLVVIYPADNPGDLATLQDLGKSGLRVILAAEEVPVGQYSLQFLDKAAENAAFGESFKASVLANVVSYENNVKVVLTKVMLGEADAGIVYASDITEVNTFRIGQIDIPDELNILASYPIALVKDSSNLDQAALFISFILSPDGQKILAKYGFIPVNPIE